MQVLLTHLIVSASPVHRLKWEMASLSLRILPSLQEILNWSSRDLLAALAKRDFLSGEDHFECGATVHSEQSSPPSLVLSARGGRVVACCLFDLKGRICPGADSGGDKGSKEWKTSFNSEAAVTRDPSFLTR